MSIRPEGTDSAPNFVVLVQSSLSVIARAITAPDVIFDVRSRDRKSAGAFVVIGLCRATDRVSKVGIGPSRLQKQIVRPAERDQSSFDRVLPVFDARCGSQALRGNGADGRQRVLDAMVQLLQDQFLQLIGRFALLRVDARLRQKHFCVDARLLKQQTKAVVLRRQDGLMRGKGKGADRRFPVKHLFGR